MKLKRRGLAIGLFLFILAICIGAILFLYHYKSGMSTVQVAVIAFVMIVIWSLAEGFLMKTLVDTSVYYCPDCHERIKPSAVEYFLTMRTVNQAYLKCPKCQKRSWCKR